MKDYTIRRFWQRVSVADKCWEWTGAKNNNGYGRLGIKYAHRVSYQIHFGFDSIPDGMTVDHLCRNRTCVNPGHLELVTRQENHRRGLAHLKRKTHCPYGHPYAGDNLAISRRGDRVCRACRIQRGREWRAAQKEEAA